MTVSLVQAHLCCVHCALSLAYADTLRHYLILRRYPSFFR